MDKSEKNILLWGLIYWIACVNTIAAIGFTLFTESYSYSYAISGTKFALICAILQFMSFKHQGELPFYKHFCLIFLLIFAYVFFIEMGLLVFSIGWETFGIYVLYVFILSLPVVLISYFVKYRLYRYRKKT
ncbi:hypothetical protein [Aliiglaciecola lipolytica]|uniref:hypothetical protein n=1 Tax=Aliiglaciecola lipolytica TaxID=477689 RepID=UPI001C09D0AD|nr:hypothetical protein [Aliiglaciecola lipolytica]MBU2877128.1 hypothetical protein [Aliiglaciecola lipolytica]